MRKCKFFCLILLALMLQSWVLPAFSSDTLTELDTVPPPPELELEAGAVILVDADTGEALYRLNDQETMYPASTTKIMTCYLALQSLDPDKEITIPDGIDEGIEDGVSTANLKSGEVLTVYQLLECLMVASANEAANAVAILVSGSIQDFVALMNQTAQELGCQNTHFVNPNGLHDGDHYTTASDLSLIAQAAMENSTFRRLCGTVRTEIPATNRSESRSLSTTNYLLPGSNYPGYGYEGALGIKTGFTTPAGYCLVAAAEKNGHTLISVVLDAPKETGDNGENVSGAFTQTAKLFDWGFANYDAAIPYQAWLDQQPKPSPEPTVEPADDSIQESVQEPAQEAEADSLQDAEPAPEAVAAPELTEASVPELTQAPTQQAETQSLAHSAPATMLLIVAIAALVLLAALVVVLILLIKRR